jgi:hypothetical protein
VASARVEDGRSEWKLALSIYERLGAAAAAEVHALLAGDGTVSASVG